MFIRFSSLVLNAVFLVNLVAAQGPPGGGGGPTFEACSCTTDANYTIARYTETLNATNRIVRTNGIPNHPYHNDRVTPNPNPVCEQLKMASLPLKPTLKGTFTATTLGVTGILKTGGFLYNHLSNFQGVNDVAKVQEGTSLDTCNGHADPSCSYHYHEISKLGVCAHDKQWEKCELIGYLLDGFPVYSHCYSDSKARYLKSCYALTSDTDGDGGGDTTDYKHVATSDCDLDVANGFNFTGQNIKDNNGTLITGYAYVASDGYPYVMAYYAGSTWASLETFDNWPGDPPTTKRPVAPVAPTPVAPVAPAMPKPPMAGMPPAAPGAVPTGPAAPTLPLPPMAAVPTAPMTSPVVAPVTAPVSAPTVAAPVASPTIATTCSTSCRSFFFFPGKSVHQKSGASCSSRCVLTKDRLSRLLSAGWTCGTCA